MSTFANTVFLFNNLENFMQNRDFDLITISKSIAFGQLFIIFVGIL